MIEVEMSKDIKDFSPKIISVFNKRQLICLGIAGFITLPLWKVLEKLDWELNTTLTILVLVAAIPISCGWVKIYGLPLETFVIKCVIPLTLSPVRRKYKTVNTLDYLDPQPEVPNDPKQLKRPKLKKLEKKKFEEDREKYGAAL